MRAREATVAFDAPLLGFSEATLRDELGVTVGDRVACDAHAAGPMGVLLLFAVVPGFVGFGGCAISSGTGLGPPWLAGLCGAVLGIAALVPVERAFRRRASLEGRVLARLEVEEAPRG